MFCQVFEKFVKIIQHNKLFSKLLLRTIEDKDTLSQSVLNSEIKHNELNIKKWQIVLC